MDGRLVDDTDERIAWRSPSRNTLYSDQNSQVAAYPIDVGADLLRQGDLATSASLDPLRRDHAKVY
jgi:hypothetical protein